MSHQPLISIIIPLYNKEECIVKTIESITMQDFGDYEIVVVDDGSKDNSVEKVMSIHDQRIKIFRKSNGGPASARNYGVKNALGKYGLFLDADDTLEPRSLKVLEELTQKEPSCEFFCCNHYIQAEGTKHLFSSKFKAGRKYKRPRPTKGTGPFN